MSKIALFAVHDKVSGNYESYGCYASKDIAARVLVATYAFSTHPAINQRLSDFELVQLSDYFDSSDPTSLPNRVDVSYGSLASIKRIFDLKDGVFAIPDPDLYVEHE